MQAYVHIYIYTQMHTQTNIRACDNYISRQTDRIHVCVYIYIDLTYIHTNRMAYIYICTHTHTQVDRIRINTCT